MASSNNQSHRRRDTIEIFVKNFLTPSYFISTLVVKPTDTIYSVMAKMEMITDVPPILQRMIVNGRSLYDYTPGTLADHRIAHLTTLDASFCVSGYYRLRKKTLAAQGIAVGDAVPADVEEEAGAPPVQQQQQEADGKMRMAVADYMMPGPKRTFTLEVEAGDTVASVMEQVQRRRGYPVALQYLTCGGTAMRPDGVATLADYNVTKDSKLMLELHLGFAIAADREERRLNKAKEIAAHVEEQQQLADDKK